MWNIPMPLTLPPDDYVYSVHERDKTQDIRMRYHDLGKNVRAITAASLRGQICLLHLHKDDDRTTRAFYEEADEISLDFEWRTVALLRGAFII